MEEKLWTEIIRSAIQWGPGMFMAAVMAYGMCRFSKEFGRRVVGAWDKQADALTAQAQSMKDQVKAMEEMKESLHGLLLRDNKDIQELKVMMRIAIDRLERGYQ